MKNTVTTFLQAKQKGIKLSMLTAYDYSTAKLIRDSGVNAILVGDSLGNVILGYEDTVSVTMEDMIHHSSAVARGSSDSLVVTDMLGMFSDYVPKFVRQFSNVAESRCVYYCTCVC